MAKNKVNLEERIPWNGENHKDLGYKEPIEDNLWMTISPELNKDEIISDDNTLRNKQGEVRSDELREGINIIAKDGMPENSINDKEVGED